MSDFVEQIDRFVGSFSSEEILVSRHAFRAILSGQPVAISELKAAVGLPPDVVEAAVEALIERGTLAVTPDAEQIVGVRGLSLVETDHRLTLEGRQLYAWCAVDVVGIPAAIGAEARVESHCHHCRTPLAFTFQGGRIVEALKGVVISAVERDLTRSLRAFT